ncbi:MAG: DEAD/DEAH box helicase [Alphaproteobacteria bacterium]
MTTFQDFGLSAALNTSLSKMKYKEPTPIQEQAIPLALTGRDILGSAQTGTGKTAAFSIPLVEHLINAEEFNCALILTPTRELAKQVLDVVHDLLGPKSGINTAFIIGGDPYRKQHQQLDKNPRIIVGTPGRINDHLEKGSIDLSRTDFLVLDETDRMLDMGFGVQLDRIVKHLPAQRQTLMFSATMPDGIAKLSAKYLNNPERVSVGETNTIAVKIKQETIHIEQADKYQELLVQLETREGTIIVFVKTKYNAEKMAKKLREAGHTAGALHGDLRQAKRDKVMRQYRDKTFRILVATDIAARGLDVPHIAHVINYDLPQVAEDYIHRMGRTARAGAEGAAISFISSSESRKWHAIEMLLDPEAAMHKYSEPERRKKTGRKKPYRGRPVKDSSDQPRGTKPKRKAPNNNTAAATTDTAKPKKNKKERYVSKAERAERGETANQDAPKKKHKTKRDKKFAPKFAGTGDSIESQFVKDRKPKKKKINKNKGKPTTGGASIKPAKRKKPKKNAK